MLHGHVEGSPCPRCGEALIRRNDDTVEALEQRLRIYRQLTLPVVGYYNRTAPQLLHRIKAEVGTDAVFSAISQLIS